MKIAWIMFAAMATVMPVKSQDVESPQIVRLNKSVRYLQRTMQALENSTVDKPAKLKVMFYGQSIVAQGWHGRVIEAWKKHYPTAQFSVACSAIGGYDSRSLRRTAFTDLYPFQPDVLFFHVYGPLDKYEEIVRTVREKTAAEIVLWSSHMAAKDDPVKMLAKPDERTRGIAAIAEKYHCVFVDLNRKWAEYLVGHGLKPQAMLRDSIHLDKLKGSLDLYAGFIAEDLVRIPGAKGDAASGTITTLKGGDKRIAFNGVRLVGVVAKPGSARVRFDGLPIEENADMYFNTRASCTPMWMPAVNRVQWKTCPGVQK